MLNKLLFKKISFLILKINFLYKIEGTFSILKNLSVPPKTYSMRKGPLIRYSVDLALAYETGQVNRKRKAPSCPKQEVEKQLHTPRDLTGTILAFGKKMVNLRSRRIK